MSHQISNQASIVSNGPGPLSVRHSRSLDDGHVVAHVVNERHVSMGQDRVTNANLSIGFRDRGPLHRSGIVSHEPGEDPRKIKAASEVVKRLGKT